MEELGEDLKCDQCGSYLGDTIITVPDPWDGEELRYCSEKCREIYWAEIERLNKITPPVCCGYI